MGNQRNQWDNEQQHWWMDTVFQSPYLCQVRQTARMGTHTVRQRAIGNRLKFAGRFSWTDRGRNPPNGASVLKGRPRCRPGCCPVADPVAGLTPWKPFIYKAFFFSDNESNREIKEKNKNSIRDGQGDVAGFLKPVAGLRCRHTPCPAFCAHRATPEISGSKRTTDFNRSTGGIKWQLLSLDVGWFKTNHPTLQGKFRKMSCWSRRAAVAIHTKSSGQNDLLIFRT